MAQTIPINTMSVRLQTLTTLRRTELANDEWGNDDAGRLHLHPFIVALKQIDAGTFGIAVPHIARVVQAWQGCEDLAWDSGYLVDLVDGRRADITLTVEGHDWEKNVEVSVDFYKGSTKYWSRVFGPQHCTRLYGWTDEVEVFNAFLETLRGEGEGAGDCVT